MGHEWAIVLAGGAGARLSALTTGTDGVAVPKQYCSLDGGPSLLAEALARARRIVPRERTLVVVAQEHHRHWQRELAGWPESNVIVQPLNRGTAPGILLPILCLLERDPLARVVLLPSDHFIEREAVLERSLRTALAAVAGPDRGLVLLGITPDVPEPDYGWIVPGARRGALHDVEAFVEKPCGARAQELLRSGAVWSSFLIAASLTKLLGLYRRRLPALLACFILARPERDVEAALALYERLEPVDFSRTLLQGSEACLSLSVVPACGWTDLGTPQRVAACLARRRRGRQRVVPAPLRAIRDLAAALTI